MARGLRTKSLLLPKGFIDEVEDQLIFIASIIRYNGPWQDRLVELVNTFRHIGSTQKDYHLWTTILQGPLSSSLHEAYNGWLYIPPRIAML